MSPERHPLDWYVEPRWCVEQMMRVTGDRSYWGGEVWDPACGMGTIPATFDEADIGIHAFGTDIADRGYRHFMGEHDFLGAQMSLHQYAGDDGLSIVANPPYSYKKGIAEAFVRRAMAIATAKVAVLVPVKWLASGARYRLFTEHRPEAIKVHSERPSMPPGDVVEKLGAQAFKRGKVDYCWIIWDVRQPGDAQTDWIAPRPKAVR